MRRHRAGNRGLAQSRKVETPAATATISHVSPAVGLLLSLFPMEVNMELLSHRIEQASLPLASSSAATSMQLSFNIQYY